MKTRDEVLSGSLETPWEQIDIPEWDGTFKLRPLTGAQAEEIQLLAEQALSTGNYLCLRGMRGKVATWVVCDMDSEQFFKPDDAPKLTAKYNAVLTRIWGIVKVQNGLESKEAEAIEKN